MKRILTLILVSLFFITIPPTNVESQTWENEYGKLEVWPDTSTNIIRQTQYCNLTSYVDDTDIDVTFRFPFEIGNPDIWLWKNMSHDVSVPDYGMISANYTLFNITDYLVLDYTPEAVDYGDIPSLHYANGTIDSIIYTIGFDSFVWDNPEHTGATFTFEYNGISGYHNEVQWWDDWFNIKHLFSHLEHNDQHYYYVTEWLIKNQEYKFKWQYDVPLGSNGKWDLMAKKSSDPIGTWRVQLDPWWDSDWDCYINLTIDHNYVEADLTNYPVMVFINETLAASCNGGNSIRFIGLDNVTEYYYELEQWPSSNNITAWVNITSVSSTVNTSFLMYYDNAAATDNQHDNDVWDNYMLVLHMNDSSYLYDSSGNDNHQTATGGTPASVDGKFSPAIEFDGVDEYFKIDNSASLTVATEDYTVETWFRTPALDTAYRISWSKTAAATGAGYKHFFFYKEADANTLNTRMRKDAGNWVTVTPGDNIGVDNDLWHYSFTKRDGTTLDLDIEKGAITATDTNVNIDTITSAADLYIGRHDDVNTYWYKGALDEIRISKFQRSYSYLNASYNNTNYSSLFLLWGEPVCQPPPADISVNFSGTYPTNQSINICPCCDAIGLNITQAEGLSINVTFWYNFSGHNEYQELQENFTNGANGSYYLCTCNFFYNTTYHWYVNVSSATDSSLYNYNTSGIYELTTASSPLNCTCLNSTAYDAMGGGISYAWIVGIIIVFSIFGIIAFLRKENEK